MLRSDDVTGMVDAAARILRSTSFLSRVNAGVELKNWRLGCFLTILHVESEIPLVRVMLGDIPPDRRKPFYEIGFEKALGLRNNPEHVSSCQIRVFDKQRYGGAIRAGQYIISPSGFPDFGDEALALILARKRDLVKAVEIEHILSLSGNAEKYKILEEAAQVSLHL